MLYINYPSWLKPEIIAGLPIRWYGLMYIVAFSIAYILFSYQLRAKNSPLKLNKKDSEDLFFSTVLGLLLGARLLYVVLYNPLEYLANPLSIIWPFSNGQFTGIQGISYHGGVIGAAVGLYIYCRRHKIQMLVVADMLAASIPFGYTFGRIGNFINAELYGKVSAHQFAVLFPQADLVPAYEPWAIDIAEKSGIEIGNAFLVNLPRFPSQLYEAFFEGIVLGLFLWFIIRKTNKVPGGIIAWYLIGYGVVRFFIEYLREPDSQLGYIIRMGFGADQPQIFTSLLNFSMGQLLCFIMIIIGIVLYFTARSIHNKAAKCGKAY